MVKWNVLLIITIFISCQNKQNPKQSATITSIDHIPIVVKNVDSIKKVASEILHFKVKEGKKHEGIQNCFIKFQDGTYLEFITPVDSLQSIGKYYTDFLKNRQGGTALAISVESADSIMNFLNERKILFEMDSNRIWKTVEPKKFDLFFIDYSDKDWNDSEINTTHRNEALSLKSTYIIDDEQNGYAKKYKKLDFIENGKGQFLNIPYEKLLIGKSNLYLLNPKKTKNIYSKFKTKKISGICGFEIKVRSLNTLKKLIANDKNSVIEKERIIYFFSDNNFFLEFTE